MNYTGTYCMLFLLYLVSFTWFLSDHRFPICRTCEGKNCEAENNDTGIIESLKFSSETEGMTRSATGNIPQYEPTDAIGNIDARNKGILVVEEVDRSTASLHSEQPPIATFDEWTKEKLKREEMRKAEQQQQQNHQHKVDVGEASKMDSVIMPASNVVDDATRLSSSNVITQEAATRNYASKECGAKVLFSNEEAENKNAVLTEKEADDYMRNPCERAEHKWLIIELCETVQPTALEIANFELFSSGPQNIRLLGSERYPSNEWIVLGDFVAENNREIQRFPIVARSYIKFIRLELLTHYGREHYCTLSLVRFLGISMVDEYEAEAEAAAAISEAPFSFDVKVNAVNNTTVERIDRSTITVVNSTREVVREVSETAEKNESTNEMPLVNAVVNAVGSIGIGSIKDVIESTFLLKSINNNSFNITRKSATVVDLCTKCFLDPTDNYYQSFCRAFFGSHYTVNNNISITKDKRGTHVQSSSFKKSKQRRKNRSKILKLFFASVLLADTCEMEMENPEDAQHSLSSTKAASDVTSAAPPIANPPIISPLLNGKLNAGFMIPGGVMSHKESIFLKLNKRISNLELNMSLSSEYLSELSRRYVLQTNESRRQTEFIVKQAEEAAINAIKPTIDALKNQMDTFAANLRELRETVKGLPERATLTQRTIMLKHLRGEGNSADSSLAHSQAHLYDIHGLWTTGELVCIVVFVNILTLLILLLLHYVFTVINHSAVIKVVDERLEKFIQENIDIQSSGEVREKSKSASTEPDFHQQLVPEMSTVSCDMVEIIPAESIYSSLLEPSNETCSLTENETTEDYPPDRPQTVETGDRPSSRLSTSSEQNPWQTRKRKRKKRRRIPRITNLDEPQRGFTILSNLGTE